VLIVSSLFISVHQLSTQRVAYWIMMDRTLLIRVRKLVSSGVSTGWVGVFSDGHWRISVDGTVRGGLVKVFSSLCLPFV
jgi:hypothetical protein